MAVTTNIGLTLFEGSDFVSREAINNNFELIADSLGIDYIVERGASGDWEWVKYKSGFMEMWVADKVFATQNAIKWGNGTLYRTPNMNFGDYPIAFVSNPLFFVTFNGADNTNLESLIGYDNVTSTTTSKNFFISDPSFSSATVLTGLHFGCYARGYYQLSS